MNSFLSSFLAVSTRVLALGIHTRAFSPRLGPFHEGEAKVAKEKELYIERERERERERDWNDGQEGGRKGLECPSEEE